MGTSDAGLTTLAEELEPEGDDTPEVVPQDAPVKEEPKTEEVPEKEEVVPETPETPATPDPLLSVEEQNRELRQILRQQRRDMAIMQAKLSRVEKRSAAATKEADEEVDDIFASANDKATKDQSQEEISPIEAVQQQLSTIARVKGPVLDTLLEVMEVSPQYTDVRDVCSQANFNDMFEAIGDEAATREGKDPVVAALEAEAAVWNMPNPYKFMYDLIKKHHPKYADRQPATPETKVVPRTEKAKAEVPQSIASVPGKGAPTNAWTAARIDEMPEEDLDEVPKDIYNKYLRGELD